MARCKRLFLQLITLQIIFSLLYIIDAYYRSVEDDAVIAVHLNYVPKSSEEKVKIKLSIADKYTHYTISRLNLTGQVINDVTSFEYFINNDALCQQLDQSAPTTLLVVIVSASVNLNKRKMIRSTWARDLMNSTHQGGQWARYTFLIGSASAENQRTIDEEHQIHSDVIQLKLPDDYSNLTLKSVALLHWVDKFCPKVHLILKCDDDIFINVRALASLTQQITNLSNLYGNGIAGDQPKRKSDNKYYVSHGVWPWTTYPPYLFGGSYLIGRDAVRHLLAAAQTTPYFVYEDVYLTGLCAMKANINLQLSKRMYERIFPAKLNQCFIRETAMWQTQKLNQFRISQEAVDRVYTQHIQCTKLCNYLQIC